MKRIKFLPFYCADAKKNMVAKRRPSPVVPVAIFALSRGGEAGKDEEGTQPSHLQLETRT